MPKSKIHYGSIPSGKCQSGFYMECSDQTGKWLEELEISNRQPIPVTKDNCREIALSLIQNWNSNISRKRGELPRTLHRVVRITTTIKVEDF